MKSFQYAKHSGISVKLDPGFQPAILAYKAYQEAVLASHHIEPIAIYVERENGQINGYETIVFKESAKIEQNHIYLDHLAKSLLWIYGGYQLIVVGPKIYADQLRMRYTMGERTFDASFFSDIYHQPFSVIHQEHKPECRQEDIIKIGRHLEGNRIGFDAGGSDMKVSAVKNGKTIWSTEVVWYPKTHSDPLYHVKYIQETMSLAAEKLPRVDAIGVSSAGIFVNNQTKVSSLFREINKNDFDQHIKDIYVNIAKHYDVPVVVANDGDVTALAGSMSLGVNRLLGIAMGTSEAAGYVDEKGNIKGWLNELAFVQIDVSEHAAVDEWSMESGCGAQYLCQEAVIRLAEKAGIKFPNVSPAEKLKMVQQLPLNQPKLKDIYEGVGTYLGYAIAFYAEFYDIEHVLILGRVTSGHGGQLILKQVQKVLNQEFPKLSEKINVTLPDEISRRVGQSIAAASLPELK